MASASQRLVYYSKVLMESLSDYLQYPVNLFRTWNIVLQRKLKRLFRDAKDKGRQFQYNPSLVPNQYVAQQDALSKSNDDAIRDTGFSIGYPAWNLLYYSLYSSLHFTDSRLPVIVETGTNHGFSTIIMAQVLKDLNIHTKIMTVEFDAATMEIAKKNIEAAGLSDYVEFHVADSLEFLRNLVARVDNIDFAFLDDNHDYTHVRDEFAIIYTKVLICRGKVYFDNTSSGGVARVLRHIKRAYGGNIVEFLNCSWGPSGNAIWQG